MCGISGFLHFDRDRPAESAALQRMSDALVHRGPDGEGLHVQRNVALAHRRLAIIDLSAGHQPMFNDDRSVAIIFNGEIYNYLELRKELEDLGHRFRTQSDTEVIVRAYEQWGTDLHARLNGMWAFAIWDERSRQLFLSRDRLGEKPLYYAQSDRTLLFASELKSLIAYGLPRNANLEVLEIYLSLGYVPAPFSFVEGVNKLPAGHFVVTRDGNVQVHKYWDLPPLDEDDLLRNRHEAHEGFRSLIHDSIRLRMRSDVSFGAFLSGGLDSSAVVAVMSGLSDRPIETFTIGFEERGFDERVQAREVAKRFGTNHHEYTVTPDSLDESARRVLKHFDEPFGDSSAIPTGYVSKCASESVKMVLTGDGGDEALSGYNAYQSEKFSRQYRQLPGILQALPVRCLDLASSLAGNTHALRVARLGRVLRTSRMEFNERLLTKASRAEIDLARSLLRPVAAQVFPVDEYLGNFMRDCTYNDNFYRMMYYHLKLSLPDDMLTKVDRMSMAYSIEARVPFLDHRLIEFMARTHKDVKMRGYERKSILRATIGEQLPRSILTSPKKGFEAPVREWYKDPSRTGVLAELLAHTPLDPDRALLGEAISSNTVGEADYGSFLWILQLLGLWFKEAG